MKTIALCFSTPGMAETEWMRPDYGKRFPGAGFMRHLGLADQFVVDGNRALDLIGRGQKAEDFIVIQEENNPIGEKLTAMGADPRVLMCLESPIFASSFYDNIPKNFKHSLLFSGGTEHLCFPSFDDEDLKDPVPWNDRKFLCMVTSNKHYNMLPKNDRPSFKKAMETQLHDYRYEAISYFLSRDALDLYGRGWDNFRWKLAYDNSCKSSIGECEDKLATIRNYKFALCFENGSYPGYVTEKIIDCLVAGVVPVYLGAPDIVQHVPTDLFIHADGFCSFASLAHELPDPKWAKDDWKMLNRAQDWLRSPDGQRYNNRVFAKRILEMCE